MHWVIIFLGVALVAAIFGFTGIASATIGVAQILFAISMFCALVAFFMRQHR